MRLLPLVLVSLAVAPNQDAANDPAPRRHAAMAFDPELGEVVLAGGGAAKTAARPEVYFDDLWSWDGTRWRERSAHTGFAQCCARLLWDAPKKRMLLHGGLRSDTGTGAGKIEIFGELRELRMGKWEVIDAGAERRMCDHAAFREAGSGALVLFGAGRTWRLRGEEWTSATGGPGELIGFGAAHDTERDALVVFGGFTEASGPSKSTWELAGGAWQEVARDGPEPRDAPLLVHDARAAAVVLYGGVGEQGEHTDTWEWRDGKWTRIAADGPGPFDMPAMAYDQERGVTVLVGTPLAGGAMQVWESARGQAWKRAR